MVFQQDTTNVTHTSQLDNHFVMIAAAQLDDSSWFLDTIFKASGRLISIQDYNNEAQVEGCLKEGCEYTFKLTY